MSSPPANLLSTELQTAARARYLRSMGKFEIYKDKAGEFRFRLKAGNGEVIMASEGYKRKDGAENGARSVMKNATDDHRFERKTSSSDQPYFVLKAANGEVIGTSQMYSSSPAMENGIQSVMKNAPEATIEEVPT